MECITTSKKETDQPTMAIFSISSLYSYLLKLKDRRKPRGLRYELATVVLLFCLAKICGQDSPSGVADWVQNRSEYIAEGLHLKRRKMPHHSTYRRLLAEVGGDQFDALIGDFLVHLSEVGQEVVIAIDGKTFCGTITLDDPFGLHLLAAYLPGKGIVLMQMVVEKDKENEIVVAPKLLQSLDLHGKIVVGDAMQTQRDLSVQIVEAGGEFVWTVKDNQPNTRKAIAQLFAPEKPVPGLGCPPMDFGQAKTIEKNGGRLENRAITTSSLLNDYLDWPSVGQVFKLERRFTDLATGKLHHEIQYGLTSLTADEASPARLLAIVRSEWGIENGLHYRRDVTFHEDQTRMTNKSAARAMATINNLVVGLFKHLGFDNHAQARRFFDANPGKALALIC
jgi:predicted transposase YbfD/YdcC